MKNIILIAAPAAGKGTLSTMLVDKYNYAHISTGDLLRDASHKESEMGKKIASILEKGELVTDDIVFSLLEKRLMESDTENGYILDGFPRTLEQAKKYQETITKLNKNLGIVIVLDTDYEILKNRIVGRVVCPKCGSVYNTLTGVNTPKVDNICDKCGGCLIKRSDDNEESFKTRYETYLEKTKLLIDYYKNIGNLHFVNSTDMNEMLMKTEELLHD